MKKFLSRVGEFFDALFRVLLVIGVVSVVAHAIVNGNQIQVLASIILGVITILIGKSIIENSISNTSDIKKMEEMDKELEKNITELIK